MIDQLARLVNQNKDGLIQPYSAIGWGKTITMLNCPTIQEGWPLGSISICPDVGAFDIDPDMVAEYQSFKTTMRFGSYGDNTKYMLTTNPTSFSDNPELHLHVTSCLWSHLMFYRRKLNDTAFLQRSIDRAFRGDLVLDFPNSLCLHIIVVTSDSMVVITKRPPDVTYFPGAWSATIEEQLSTGDISSEPAGARMSAWAQRALWEELGLSNDVYDEDDFRVLSVFLEGDALNVSLCAIVQLKIDRHEISSRLRSGLRVDRELTEFDFIFLERSTILNELLNPSRTYHPTTAYRFLYAFLNRFGSSLEAADLRPFGTIPDDIGVRDAPPIDHLIAQGESEMLELND